MPELVLILVDADKDLACELGPRLLATAASATGRPTSCVIATVCYETWFAAGAESLSAFFRMAHDEVIPDDPEAAKLGKGWVKQRFRGSYSETMDQPRMSSVVDLTLVRKRSRSFDKLCRELARIGQPAASG